MKFKAQTNYDHDTKRLKQGLLLCNLGTPQAPTARELRIYLKEFLSDSRVVEIPKLIWWFILNVIILRIRPAKSAKLYQRVWTDSGSPLYSISEAQCSAMRKKLEQQCINMPVALGMRYGQPSISHALDELRASNVDSITILPLYPQYCAATTASTFDAIAQYFSQQRWVPSLHFISGYHQNPLYINAVAESIIDDIKQQGKPDKIVFSYHGIPQRNLDLGDPYYCFCMQTTRLVKEALALKLDDVDIDSLIETTFQSRFGKAQWLQPYTEATLISYAKQNIANVAVICPGFSADCLETLDEIGSEAKKVFIESGGQSLRLIPCLNDSEAHIDALFDVITH